MNKDDRMIMPDINFFEPQGLSLFAVQSEEDRSNSNPKNENAETKLRHSNIRILVVEDELKLRKIAITTLEDEGYNVFEAADGKQALEYISDGQNFDLLFTDILMPGGMNGVEVSAIFQKTNPEIKVLYTTGYLQDVKIPGVVDTSDSEILLIKPYRQKKLIKKIESILSHLKT